MMNGCDQGVAGIVKDRVSQKMDRDLGNVAVCLIDTVIKKIKGFSIVSITCTVSKTTPGARRGSLKRVLNPSKN